MVRFKVYYDGGMEFDSEVGGKLPERGVQVIVQDHPDIGWHTQSGYDYYVRRDGRWVGVDLFGLYDWLLDQGDVLFGRTLSRKQFNEVMAVALKDLGEAKTGWLRDERKPI
jgi:hypothetical protein